MKTNKSSSGLIKKTIFYAIYIMTVLIFLSCGKSGDNKDSSNPNSTPDVKKEATAIPVKGKVKLADRATHEGVVVYIAGTTYSARTSKDGSFAFPPLPEGQYEIYAEKNGYQDEMFQVVNIDKTVLNSSTEIMLETLVLQPGENQIPITDQLANFTGHASLENETNYEGIMVKIKGTDIKTVTDNLGEYTFRNLTPGTYSFILSKDFFKTVEYGQEIGPGENAQLQESIILKREEIPDSPRKVMGAVDIFDSAGNPMNNFSDVIVSLEGTSFMASPDSTGKFAITNVPAGKYTVNATALNFVNRNKIDIDITTNNEITVSVYLDQKKIEGATGTVSGNIKTADEAGEASDISVALAGTSFMAVPDSGGKFVLSTIPEGDYVLVARAEGYNSIKVENIKVVANQDTPIGDYQLEKRITAPEILSTSPYDGQDDIVITRRVPLTVRFSKKMKPDSVKKSFSIKPAVSYKAYIGKEHPQADYDLLYVELQGISDRDALEFGTKYKVTISQEASDYEGGKLAEDYVFEFKTVTPCIIGSDPVDGEQSAFLSEGNPVSIRFNGKIKYDSFADKNIRIEPAPKASVRTYFREDPHTGWSTAMIYTTWEMDKRYTVTIGSGVKLDNGKALGNTPYTIKFKTSKMIEAKPGFN